MYNHADHHNGKDSMADTGQCDWCGQPGHLDRGLCVSCTQHLAVCFYAPLHEVVAAAQDLFRRHQSDGKDSLRQGAH